MLTSAPFRIAPRTTPVSIREPIFRRRPSGPEPCFDGERPPATAVDEILITDKLKYRRRRRPDPRQENIALLNLAKVGPALATGNVMVLKPSPYTPFEALLLGEAADEAQLPPGVLNIVTGGKEVGEMLTADPRVDMISFTGSDAVGAAIMSQAAPSLK